MRPHRVLLAATAAVALLVPLASPAVSATTAAGAATSSGSLVKITAVGHTVVVGTLSAGAQTVTSAVPAVSFTPLDLDGTKTGQVTVDPSNSPKTVGGVTTSGVPAAILSATSPSVTLQAAKPATGPVSGLVGDLGSASVLGIPLTLDGEVDVSSATSGTQSAAGKALTISRVALPSIADLLAALGLDLGALPVGTLNGLLEQLPLTLSSATTAAAGAANTAIDAAQLAVDGANQTLATEQQELDSAESAAAEAQADFEQELSDAGIASEDAWNALTDVQQLAYPLVLAAEAVRDQEAQDLVAAQDDVDDAQAALNTALANLAAAVGQLADVVAGALDTTPLVELGTAEVATSALVGASKSASVTGSVSGLKVLGEDVLAAVFGSSTLDIADLLGTGAGTVSSAIASYAGTLASVLSAATGATGLVVPAPSISVLVKSATTGTDGEFGTADASVTVLRVSLGSITLPTAFALPNAATLPGLTQTASGFTTAPLSLDVATLVESARFRPGSATNTPGTGSLPATGAPLGLAILALVAGTGALGLRRLGAATR